MMQRGRKSAAKLATLQVNGDPPRLTPPSHLTSRERRLFTEIVESCSPKHFTKADLPTLISYTQSILLAQSAIKKAATAPASLTVWTKATQLQTSLARALRLTVQSRADPKTIGRNTPTPWALRPPWEDWGDADAK